MKAIQLISQDLFDKIRSRFKNLEMGDETGSVTIDPAEARFFDFDFIYENANLGRVSISLNDAGALKIYYSQGLTENQDDFIKKYWYNFLKEMRYFAMRRLLRFDTRDIAKTNLDQNDFQYLASTKPKDEENMTMNESRWMLEKSSRKTSRAVKGKTQVIVRHNESMAERRIGERSNPKRIKAIYIENSEGERYKYPFIHPAGAFAMAQHVDHGGVPHDPAGKAIIKMSEQIAQLQEFKGKIQFASLNNDATGMCERAIGRLNELKGRVAALGKRHHYESWLAEFNETEQADDEVLSELDPVTFEDYKSKFTQSAYNEELGKYFPLLHSIMQEKVDLESYVGEKLKGNQGVLDVDHDGKLEKSDFKKLRAGQKEGFEQFEQWAEAVEPGNFDRQALDDKLQGMALSDKLDSISLGPDGSVAWAELSDLFGFDERDTDDAALKDQLAAKAKTADQELTGIDGPAMDVFKSWVEDSFPEWKKDLPELFPDAGADQQMTPEPETGMQPVAAPQPGVNPNATPSPETGMNPAPKPQPVAEDTKKSIIQTIAERVKSFWNGDNENGGPWPKGQEGVVIEVEKEIKEKFGEKAGDEARQLAEKFVAKLTMEWQKRHGQKLMGEKNVGEDSSNLDVDNILAKLEKEIYYKKLKGKDALHYLRVQLLDLALNQVGRDKRKGYEPHVMNVKNWDDAKEFLTVTFRDAREQGAVEQTKALPEMESILKLAGLIK